MPATNADQVPCKSCRTLIPAARARIPLTNGCCAGCNEVNLAVHRPPAPEYETVVWSRGERL